MKLHVKGGGEVTLSKADYLAGGGEGAVYVKGGRAFKVYHDPKRMIPVGKIGELAAITDSAVVKPERVLCDDKGTPVGYDMAQVTDAFALCQTFPRAFREREGLTHAQALALVQRMQAGVRHVHGAGVLLVDLNEMNFLVGRDFARLYFIDADSYQTKSYPATAIMESVRDPQVDGRKFTEGSDWFSFAVVSFQVFTGIHPYKGKHPVVRELRDRMAQRLSVLGKDVRVPAVVYPFDVIPPAFRAWYEAVLEHGKREAPPTDPMTMGTVQTVARAVASSAGLDVTLLFEMANPIRGLWEAFGVCVVATDAGVYVDHRRVLDAPPWRARVAVAFLPRSNRPIAAWVDGQRLHLVDLATRTDIAFPMHVEQMMATGGRLYVKVRDQIHEVTFAETATRTVAAASPVANCMLNATRLFDGAAMQSMLGSAYVSLFPRAGASHTVRVKELDGYTVVEARAERNVLMVVGARGGKYDRIVFRFDETFSAYDCRVVADVPLTGLNFTVLDTGIVACLAEDERLELFSSRKDSAGIRYVEDAALGGDLTLGQVGGKVACWRDRSVYRLTMK